MKRISILLMFFTFAFSFSANSQIEIETWAAAQFDDDTDMVVDIFAGKTFDSGVQVGLVANYGTHDGISFNVYDRVLVALPLFPVLGTEILIRFQGIVTSGLFKKQETFESAVGVQYNKWDRISLFGLATRDVPDNNIGAQFGFRLKLK